MVRSIIKKDQTFTTRLARITRRHRNSGSGAPLLRKYRSGGKGHRHDG